MRRQGLVPGEYALHSGRNGRATRLVAGGGVKTMEIQRHGRWKSVAFMMGVSALIEEADKLSNG